MLRRRHRVEHGCRRLTPAGGSASGTQCFAWSFKLRDGRMEAFSETRRFEGERNDMRRAAAMYALSRIEHYFDELSGR